MAHTFRLPGLPIQLDESIPIDSSSQAKISENVQILRTGSFSHPDYGNFSITTTTLQEMVKNFSERVRGVDISIDYAHESDKVAAGWIKGLFLSDDRQSLWARVEWTPRGRKVLADREYRYLSADFVFEYQNNETLKKYGPTLFGAGLTNRPVIKEMEPVVELAEAKEGAGTMSQDLEKENKQLKEQLAQLQSQLAAAQKKAEPIKAADASDSSDGSGDETDDVQGAIDDLKSRVTKLEAWMAQDQAEDQAEVNTSDKKLSEREREFQVLLSEGKAVKAQKEAYVSGDMRKFAELSKAVHTKNTGHGGAGTDSSTNESAEDQALKLAQAKIKEGSAKTLGDALSLVLSERKDLRQAYEKRELPMGAPARD